MKLNSNNLMFLVDLFDDYKNKIFIYMRKNKYHIVDIMDFVNGYSIVSNNCYQYAMDITYKNNYNIFSDIIFNDCNEIVEVLHKIMNESINKINPNKWEFIGIKYAYCLARFYIRNVLSGLDNDVEEDDLYMSIPDKIHPENYDWDAHGLDI